MSFLATLFGKGLLAVFGNAILAPILSHLDAKAAAQRDTDVARIGADRDRDLALVSAEMAANVQRAAMATEFKALVYLIALPFVLHAGAVMVDATFTLGWPIARTPAPLDGYEGAILMSFFVLSPAASLAKAASARLVR